MNSKRLPPFDAIRALAAILGVMLHTSAGYLQYPIQEWPQFSQRNSIFFDYLAWAIHMFRVPIFFFLAGFFAYTLWKKLGLRGFTNNRMRRIFIPFVIFTCILNLPALLIKIMMQQVHSLSDVLQSFYNLGYLWFLDYLIIYYLVFCCLASFMKEPLQKSINNFVRRWLTSALGWTPLIIVSFIALYISGVWATPISLGFVPNVGLLITYAIYFSLGTILAINNDLLGTFFSFKSRFFYIALTAYIVYAICFMFFSHTESHRIFTIGIYSVASYYLFFLFVSLCMKWFTRENAAIRFMSDASYWIYLIHIPIIFSLQWYLRSSTLPLYIQFIFISFSTLFIAGLSYQIFVKNSYLGRKKEKDYVDILSTAN